MDGLTFDRIARTLGTAATRRAALAALVGIASAGTAHRAAGKRRCRRDSPPGQCCRNRDGGIACTCNNGGIACGANCCLVGQRCEDGTCVELPEPGQCVVLGQPCKGVGLPCCEGLRCESGQGGKTDVACYKPVGAACQATAECTYGSDCQLGVCVARPQPDPEPTPAPCRGSIPVTGNPKVDGEALRALAEDPDGPATITLCAGLYQAAQEIAIVRSLSIEAAANAGGEVVLDGGWSGGGAEDGHRVMSVGAGYVRLTGITVRRGYFWPLNEAGGCLSIWGSADVTLTRVRVTACSGRFGAGMAIGGAALLLQDSELSDNVAAVAAGFLAIGATVTLAGATRVSGNIAEVYAGGFLCGADAFVTLRDAAVVTGNGSRRAGGFEASGSCSVSLQGIARISGNAAFPEGAGFVVGDEATVRCAGAPKVCANPDRRSDGCVGTVGQSCIDLQLCSDICPT